MTRLSDTDIRLDDTWQLTQAADGDAPACSGLDCLYQNIALEAETQKGSLFYDPDFGWSLYDLIQAEDTELNRLELIQRARSGLGKREVIRPESIVVQVSCEDDVFRLRCRFQFAEESETRQLTVVVSAVSVEVVTDD